MPARKNRPAKRPVQLQHRPELISYDSSHECSLDHWLEVYWLVEEEYRFAKAADAEIWEEVSEQTLLEV
ncbi:MAG TPA: hypothetical protein VLZ50_01045 [Terracidiphilus sp.]|nr:hypothetical protein [Terracidiphilus sp.]